MTKLLRRVAVGTLLTLASDSLAVAQLQQQQAPQQAPAQPLPGQQGQPLPPQFQLNAMQQAYLDQVLNSWQQQSGKVTIFQCPFERWEYNQAFGPVAQSGERLPLNKNKGELSYQKPDKGSFEIQEVRVWQAKDAPAQGAPPGQPNGDWILQKDAIGEHWVCDGQNVYEYSQRQKKLIVRPIPAELQGKAIVDGPLPFLFGAEAAKLKQRYWMRAEQNQQSPNTIFLSAVPKFAAQAADYKQVDVMLDRTKMMPTAIQVHLPNGDRHVYMFDIANASVNTYLQRFKSLFQAPTTPWGWERVVEAAPPQMPQQPQPLDNRQALQPQAGEVPR